MNEQPLTLLCLASNFKGVAFLKMASQLGCKVILLTRQVTQNEEWPRESLDAIHYMPDIRKRPDIFYAVSYLARSQEIHQVIALDDFDVETAGALRDHLAIGDRRLPGLSESHARHFRDKLTMRILAQEAGVPVPPFTGVFNYSRLNDFMQRVPPPWLLKPRSEASSMGIATIHYSDELWPTLERLGDQQSFFVLEKFVPGDVFHVDGLVENGRLVFVEAHRYASPPMSVYQGGGVFITRTLERGTAAEKALVKSTQKVLKALDATWGAVHIEFIRAHADGKYYFLECANRVGGANIAEMVEIASGINLWAQWACIEAAHLRGQAYQPPERTYNYAAVMNCLARQEWPDLSSYDAPEVVWRANKRWHAGLVLSSPDSARLQAVIEAYSQRFAEDFLAVLPPREKAD
jgi:biotin carboxylase